ncbi:MAG: hypothetical protein ACUVSX_14795 [Aggregatilineales bacterium]
MDKLTLCEMLDAPPHGVFTVTDLLPHQWGAELVFDCLYQPPGQSEPLPFFLILKDCRDMRWRIYAHLKPPDDQTLPQATLVNLRLGAGNHHKPLHLLTDFFGISVSYGDLVLRKDT